MMEAEVFIGSARIVIAHMRMGRGWDVATQMVFRLNGKKIALSCVSLIIDCGCTSQRDICRCDRVLVFDIDKERILQARRNDQNAHHAVCDVLFSRLCPSQIED